MFAPTQQYSIALRRRPLHAAFLSSASRAGFRQHGSFPPMSTLERSIHLSTRRPLLNNQLLDADTTPTHLALERKTPSSTIISSSPILLPPSLWLMSVLAHATNPLLNPDKNPLLRFFLKKTVYAQFCAGETPAEVGRTIKGLKDIGFSGVILGYAKEVALTNAQKKELGACSQGKIAEECIRNEIIPWATGTLKTVRLAEPGDFVALKFTGAGRQALDSLAERLPRSAALTDAINSVCSLASERGVRLLFDAEQASLQPVIDDWTMEYMRKYNTAPRQALVYGTYQAYLKSTPETLSRHLRVAREEGFTLGVKLVRGAYIGTDPRHLIHETKEGTDACYDSIAESLLKKQWGNVLQGDLRMPSISLIIASHNAESVRRARKICIDGEACTEVVFAQLQGMADEVSCELVCPTGSGNMRERKRAESQAIEAYKYLVWGSTGECMKYRLRRAHENRYAVQRTRSGRNAMFSELVRRMKSSIGVSV
ncbi:proline dehydrogenase [Colletotrichum paranaense]|uniref:Proline dehydrogenase n=1 Tax=Colletotrichum paranaense TaxID=1914294 RepID=A0ABQ9T7X1_9PEZI|nr:proline dehydrogenase [Colletotrichum paranaense]KAK1547863.1 proline dehydrogenase [Colletotrichum paranaense]